MATIYLNHGGDTAQKIIPSSDIEGSKIENLTLSNVHSTDSATINLYIQHTTKFSENHSLPIGRSWDQEVDVASQAIYILKNTIIPTGAALQLTEDDLPFNLNYYAVYLKLAASTSTVDVLASITEPNLKGY